jgi:ATP-dependent DNA ligase
MNLPVQPPIDPMLATLADAIPDGSFLYEPKWDGFRALVYRDGDELLIHSRDAKPLLRYFPELDHALRAALPTRAVVDGEIVVASGTGLDFETLQLRLHPAASRIAKLAAETPASIVLFDLLAVGDDDLRGRSMLERRAALEQHVQPNATVTLTPVTRDRRVADDWFRRFRGAGLDGVMAKAFDGTYQPGKRGWVKVKHENTIDAVVAGFRWHKTAPGTEVGSLVLALFDDHGDLHPIGVASSFSKKRRASLVDELASWRDAGADHPWAKWGDVADRPDQKSRWSADKDLSWEPLRMGLVAEVHATQHDRRRLRHPAHLIRFRDDKRPEDCLLRQLDVAPPPELSTLVR